MCRVKFYRKQRLPPLARLVAALNHHAIDSFIITVENASTALVQYPLSLRFCQQLRKPEWVRSTSDLAMHDVWAEFVVLAGTHIEKGREQWGNTADKFSAAHTNVRAVLAG